jgi:hypothetical protein
MQSMGEADDAKLILETCRCERRVLLTSSFTLSRVFTDSDFSVFRRPAGPDPGLRTAWQSPGADHEVAQS